MWRLFFAMTLAALTGCSHTAPAPNTRTDKGSPAPSPAASRAVRPIAERPPFKDVLEAAAAKPSAPFEGEGWTSLFDGKTLNGWKPTDFAGHGDVECQLGMIIFEMGDPFTGLNWTGSVPRMNYEVALDAMRVNGSDFFCGLTVPVNDTACSLIVGGWGGSLIGISSMDGMDASENETTKFMNFEAGKWYRFRLRVTEARIEGWVDDEKLINVVTTDKRISVRPGEIEMSQPFGIASWQTTAALRQIKLRKVSGPAGPAGKGL
jgi:hypothetical protein